MGLIYKITNKINNKIYIGKTVQPLKTRWKQHLADSKKTSKNHNKLYRAMNKYGQENFIIEVIEDNIPIELLNEKEKFYIKLFNSFYEGYNLTFGGDGESHVDIEKVLQLYYSGKNITEISSITGYTRKTVSSRLKAEGIVIKDLHQGNLNKGKKMLFENKEFNSLTLLAKYLKENVLVFKNKDISTITKGISKNTKKGRPYCGYYFKYL